MGISPSTRLEDIKLKYRQLALIYHPDKNDGKSNELFLKIQEAYMVLSDPNTRQQYDMFIKVTNPKDQESTKLSTEEKEEYLAKKQRINIIIERLSQKQKMKKDEQEKKVQDELAAFQAAKEALAEENVKNTFVPESDDIIEEEIGDSQMQTKDVPTDVMYDEIFRPVYDGASPFIMNISSDLRFERRDLLQNKLRRPIYSKIIQQGYRTGEVDKANFTEYTNEFFNKSAMIYSKDHEFKIRDLKALNEKFERKRAEYAHYQNVKVPPEGHLTKVRK